MTRSRDERTVRFERLVDHVYEPLQRYALRRTDEARAQDVVADALLVLWRRLDDVPDGATLPWCYGVAANCLANQRRSVHRAERLTARLAALEPPAVELPPEPPDPEIHVALARLGEDDREVLRLWAWEGLAPGEIAVVLDVTANAVSIRLHRAKQRLEAELGKSSAVAGHIHDDTRKEAP